MKDFIDRLKGAKHKDKKLPSELDVTSENLVRCSSTQARSLIPYEQALELKVLPLGLSVVNGNRVLTLAASDQNDLELVNTLQFVTEAEVKLVSASSDALRTAIFKAYRGDDQLLEQNLLAANAGVVSITANTKEVHARRVQRILDQTPGQAAKIVSTLLQYAVAKSASDLHLIPERSGAVAKLRVDGLLYSHKEKLCSLAVYDNVVSLVKVLCELDTTVRRRPQDGSFTFDAGFARANIRVSFMPTVYGEKIVCRFLGTNQLIELSKLGLHSKVHQFIKSFLSLPDGMCLFVGPTGSGKSTTLYSALNEIKDANKSIVTIENPVEIYLQGISQTELDEKQGVTYASALRAVLRQDPDVILIGEVRDADSAKAALQATQTGHLILTTIHARSVFESLLRLESLQASPQSMADGLKLIIYQKLLPKLCQRCKVADLAASRVISQYADIYTNVVYRSAGCDECDHTGFSGRVLATEALKIDREIREVIRGQQYSYDQIKPYLREDNYLSMLSSIKLLIERGHISVDHLNGDSSYF